MVSFTDILTQIKQVEKDIEDGAFVQAGRDTIPIQEAIFDIAESVGFKGTPKDDETKKEIMEVAVRCQQKASALKASKPKAGAEPVGKLGDGTFLKILLDALIKFLPLVL